MNSPNSSNSSGGMFGEDSISSAASAGLVFVYCVIFVPAFFGNLMAIGTCYASYRRTTSVLLCYIASLAAADLLFTLLSTVDLAYFLSEDWPGGEASCKIHRFLMETAYSASILTLAGISYERYKAIVLRGRSSRRWAWKGSFVVKCVWIASVVSCLPLLYGYTTVVRVDGRIDCDNGLATWGFRGRKIYYSLTGVFKFLLPVLWMVKANWSICRALSSHNRNNQTSTLEVKQRKVTNMLLVVTLVFCVCWGPAVILRLVRYFGGYDQPFRWRLVQLLFFTNCALNPLLYCFYDRQFRSSFKRILSLKWNSASRKTSRELVPI